MAGGCVKLVGALVVVVTAVVAGSEELRRDKRQPTKPTDGTRVRPSAKVVGDSIGNQPPVTKKGADEQDENTASSTEDSPGQLATTNGVSGTNDTTTTTTVFMPGIVPANGGCIVPLPGEKENVNLTLSFDESPTYIHEGEVKNLTIFYSGLTFPRVMHLASSDESVLVVTSNDTLPLETTAGDDNDTVTVTLRGVRLGITTLQVVILGTGIPVAEEATEIVTHLVKTKRVPRVIDSVFNYMLLPLVLVTTCGMGCKLDTDLLKEKLRRPVPVFVGPVCQFICMPLVALSVSKLFGFDPLTAMGLITVGSCPGGGLSNKIILLVDADLVMSVTMTFLSTCLALGMLPLNLFIYSRFFEAEGTEEEPGIDLPVTNIVMQISFLTVPLLLGMLVRAKLPKIARYVIKSLNILSLTLILLTLGVGLYSNVYVTYSPTFVLLGGFLHPTCGFIIGFVVAKFIARFPSKSAVTICVETGVQNNLIAISVLKLSFEQPEADIMARMPVIVAVSAVSIGIGMILASVPVNRRRRRRRGKRADREERAARSVTGWCGYRTVAAPARAERRPSSERESGGQPGGDGALEPGNDPIPSYDLVAVEKPPISVDGPETAV